MLHIHDNYIAIKVNYFKKSQKETYIIYLYKIQNHIKLTAGKHNSQFLEGEGAHGTSSE